MMMVWGPGTGDQGPGAGSMVIWERALFHCCNNPYSGRGVSVVQGVFRPVPGPRSPVPEIQS